MSNELPWTRWTPDDLAPPLAGFTPAVMLPEEGDTEAEVPELSEEEQRAQMLAQMQMQAHEQGFNAGLNEGRQKGQEQGYQEGLAQGLEQGLVQAKQEQAPTPISTPPVAKHRFFGSSIFSLGASSLSSFKRDRGAFSSTDSSHHLPAARRPTKGQRE